MKTNNRGWPIFWLAILGAITLFLALYNLIYYPPTWYDEGIHLLVAKRLALEGEYRFGPALGPTVFLPVAAAFRLAGVELVAGRLVMVGYLLACLATFYLLARRLGGWKVATVATLLFITSPGINLVRWGRQALGEVPATFFFLLALLLWLKALEASRAGRRRGWLVLTGALLGLAILTKNQFLLLLPAWALLWLADRLYYRQASHADLALPFVAALVCVVAWYVGQRFLFPAGQQLATRNVQEWSDALSRGILTLSPRRMADALKFLTGQDALYAWALPGGLYAVVLGLRRSRQGLRWAPLVIVSVVWLGWFVLLSVGWPRYAFLALALLSVAVAQLFHDLTDGYRLPLKELLCQARAGGSVLKLGGQAALLALLLLFVLRPLQGRLSEVVTGSDDSPQRMAAYIVQNLPAGATIETYDPEICFLSGYDCHFPPNTIMDASIKYVWYNAPPPSEFYDFRAYGAPYLLIGDFGRWVHLYDPAVVERDYQLEVSIGNYMLYRVK